MSQVNIYEAKTTLSRLIERACAGEEIIIARAGSPIVKLVPIGQRTAPRPLGTLAGKITFAADWDSDEVNEAIAVSFDPTGTP